MNNIYNDKDYMNLIGDILYNNEFKKIEFSTHHGLSRLDHSLRVSYYSYKIGKLLRLNFGEIARAGLLHDFFITTDLTKNEKKLSAFVHPYKALNNSQENFKLTEREKDIIISHMFPLVPNKVPKYFESWIVSLVDKTIATYEFSYSYGQKVLCRIPNAYIILCLIAHRIGL